jgi:hypothetical protein
MCLQGSRQGGPIRGAEDQHGYGARLLLRGRARLLADPDRGAGGTQAMRSKRSARADPRGREPADHRDSGVQGSAAGRLHVHARGQASAHLRPDRLPRLPRHSKGVDTDDRGRAEGARDLCRVPAAYVDRPPVPGDRQRAEHRHQLCAGRSGRDRRSVAGDQYSDALRHGGRVRLAASSWAPFCSTGSPCVTSTRSTSNRVSASSVGRRRCSYEAR